MGIQNLLPLLATYTEKISFSELRGKVYGIDAYSWLYKGVYCAYELATGIETSRHVAFVMKRLEILEDSGILPVLVFDGKCPAMKADVEAKCRQRIKNNRVEVLKCMDE